MSRGLLVLLAILGGLMAATLFYKERAKDAASRSRWSRMLRPLVDGVHSMGKSRSFWWAGFLSFCYLALQIVPLYALLRGYGMNLSVSAALVLLVILRLGTVIPQAPGNVGSFQALIVAGLGLFGFSRADSTGFATPVLLRCHGAALARRLRRADAHAHAARRHPPRSARKPRRSRTSAPVALCCDSMKFAAVFLFLSLAALAPAQERKLRIIAIGAHPDDCDIKFAGTAYKLTQAGHAVKFLSVTNGDAGHHEIGGGMLAKRRYLETQESARRLGIGEYEVLDNHDGELTPNLEVRRQIIRSIRRWKADIVDRAAAQ